MRKTAVILFLLAAALTACAPVHSCTAVERVDVYDSPPGIFELVDQAEAVDWLDAGQSTLVQSEGWGYYEVTTPKLVHGYVSTSVCEADARGSK